MSPWKDRYLNICSYRSLNQITVFKYGIISIILSLLISSTALGVVTVDHTGVIVCSPSVITDHDSDICIIPELFFQPSFSFAELLQSLKFDRRFKSGRHTLLFGNMPYNYGTVSHVPKNFSDNRFVCEMLDFVNHNFPCFGLNSCLINYYPDSSSSIPDHSDDKLSIAENSFIVTISLGSRRRIFFKEIISGSRLCSVTLNDGSILIFSKKSQSFFTHGIPPSLTDADDYTPRISATFRNLN